MLTGCTPFVGDSPIAIALVQQSQVAPDVRSLRPDVSPRLAATVARALATAPSDRHPTAAEMAADLQNAWPPPAEAPPESAVATQLMEAGGQPAVGVRSGDTELWPVAAAGDGPPPTTPASRRRLPMKSRAITAAVVLLVGVVGATLLFGHDSAEQLTVDGAGPPTTVASDSTEVPTVPPTAAPTTAPTTAPTVDEIIPGFARTGDLQVFLQQIENDPTLVGESGGALADQLGQVLDQRSKHKASDQAKALRKQLIKWVDAGELDPAIAQALDDLLVPLAD